MMVCSVHDQGHPALLPRVESPLLTVWTATPRLYSIQSAIHSTPNHALQVQQIALNHKSYILYPLKFLTTQNAPSAGVHALWKLWILLLTSGFLDVL